MNSNPHGHLVVCARCHQRPTFTKDALCFSCRNKAAKPSKPSEVER